MKTAELTGAALDWAVAKCENIAVHILPTSYLRYPPEPEKFPNHYIAYPPEPEKFPNHYIAYHPSTNWAQGGPIIERGEVVLMLDASPGWIAKVRAHAGKFIYGQTPLIAAMRCYVSSIFGDVVNIPDELK